MKSIFTSDLLPTTQGRCSAEALPLAVLCQSADWGPVEQQTLWLAQALYHTGRPVLLLAPPAAPLLCEAQSLGLPTGAVAAGLVGIAPLARQLRQHGTRVLLTTRPTDLGVARLLKLWQGATLRLVHRQLEPLAATGGLHAWWNSRHTHAVDACVAAYPRVARQVQQHAALDPRRLWVVPPVWLPEPRLEQPAPPAEARHLLDLPARALLVGVVARDAAGPAFALEALYRLREEEGVAAELVVIGCPDTPPGADYWARLRELAGQLRLSHCVHLRPLHNAAHPVLFYQALDGLLLPDQANTAGMALLGAMAAGCPLVSQASADAPDLLEDGRTGLLFPVHDLARCAATLALALTQPGPAQRRAGRAAALVRQHCSPGRQARQLEAIIEYVCRHETLV
ncbi:glycosyltransferase [Hymenobacter aquaticus]|uniref:Glycosyltransferase n=1 Tax=Hymenobacter aquaticus TaxID=1867101 RepID=A0A4Z0Q4J8_9BACT|nr:glycosyltransferase [Hymenobacter aquaticus]TGE24980.1 glycosyltransferase [Hymenobacter aquaticus]